MIAPPNLEINLHRQMDGRTDRRLIFFYCLVWETELLLASIGLVFPALVSRYKLFNCSMYQVPVPMLIEEFV